VIDGDRVVHEARYPQPVPVVWDALTDPQALAAWLMPNDFAPVVGHRFRLDSRPGMGIIEAEVLALEPPRFIRWKWIIEDVPSEVTIRLHDDADGTRLELEHILLSASTRPSFDGGWKEKLGPELTLVLTGERDPARSKIEDGLYRYPHGGITTE
jgi:uncharacterized protein YndB with AHSA1/START domain